MRLLSSCLVSLLLSSILGCAHCDPGQCRYQGRCVTPGGPYSSGGGAAGLCNGKDGNCYSCKCASGATRVLVPGGTRAIAELKKGDRVITLRAGKRVAAPIAAVTRCAVSAHAMQRVVFGNGARWEISAAHPLADGRTVGDLRVGDSVDGQVVKSVETVSYRQPYTYDILPDSESGVYFAEGIAVGSTIPAER